MALKSSPNNNLSELKSYLGMDRTMLFLIFFGTSCGQAALWRSKPLPTYSSYKIDADHGNQPDYLHNLAAVLVTSEDNPAIETTLPIPLQTADNTARDTDAGVEIDPRGEAIIRKMLDDGIVERYLTDRPRFVAELMRRIQLRFPDADSTLVDHIRQSAQLALVSYARIAHDSGDIRRAALLVSLTGEIQIAIDMAMNEDRPAIALEVIRNDITATGDSSGYLYQQSFFCDPDYIHRLWSFFTDTERALVYQGTVRNIQLLQRENVPNEERIADFQEILRIYFPDQTQ